MMNALIALLIVPAVVFAAISVWGWANLWTKVAGDADMGAVALRGEVKTNPNNQALVCPRDLCIGADFEAPVFALSAELLAGKLEEALATEGNLTRVDDGSDPLVSRYVQRSRRLQFPDTIVVEILPLGATNATLALLSRSQIGGGDGGVNLARLKRWVGKVERLVDGG